MHADPVAAGGLTRLTVEFEPRADFGHGSKVELQQWDGDEWNTAFYAIGRWNDENAPQSLRSVDDPPLFQASLGIRPGFRMLRAPDEAGTYRIRIEFQEGNAQMGVTPFDAVTALDVT